MYLCIFMCVLICMLPCLLRDIRHIICYVSTYRYIWIFVYVYLDVDLCLYSFMYICVWVRQTHTLTPRVWSLRHPVLLYRQKTYLHDINIHSYHIQEQPHKSICHVIFYTCVYSHMHILRLTRQAHKYVNLTFTHIRLIFSLNLQVSFAKEPYKRDYILQKRPTILRSLYKYVLCLTSTHMGWLRLIFSLKLQVSFAKEPYKRNHIRQKRPIFLRSLLIVATLYDIRDIQIHMIQFIRLYFFCATFGRQIHLPHLSCRLLKIISLFCRI